MRLTADREQAGGVFAVPAMDGERDGGGRRASALFRCAGRGVAGRPCLQHLAAIDGVLHPVDARLFFEEPWWRNFFDNVLTVQFTHRSLAYLLLVMTFAHLVQVVRLREQGAVVRGALLIAAATVLQAALGVLTLLYEVPIDLALAHQAGAIAVLTLVLLQAERLNGNAHGATALQGAPMAAISGGRR